MEYISFRLLALMNILWVILILAQGRVQVSPLEDSRQLSWANLWNLRNNLFIFISMMVALALPTWIQLSGGGLNNLAEGISRNFIHGIAAQSSTLPWNEVLLGALERIYSQTSLFLFASIHPSVIAADRGIFDFTTTILGLAALTYGVFTAKKNPSRWWPILVILITIILASVLTPTGSRYRVYSVVPYFLLGIGIALDDFSRSQNFKRKNYAIVAISLLIISLSIWNVREFFCKTIHDQLVKDENYDFNLLVALELKQQQLNQPHKSLVLFSKNFVDNEGGEVFFLYDRAKVNFVSSLSEIKKGSVVVAVHAQAHEIENTGKFKLLKVWENPPLRSDRYVVVE